MCVSVVLTLAASAAAQTGQDKPPVVLKGGVSETMDLSGKDSRTVRDWGTRARQQAQGQRDVEIKKFLSNPYVMRVTHVEPVREGEEKQTIYAHMITQVTISEDGKVDLGKLVPKSGTNYSVPPETLKVGDLFTMQGNQVVKVPKDHFDPLGALSEIGKQIVEMDPKTQLMGWAEEMDRVADMLEDKAL
jgi:hypothetical protein